MNTLTWEVIEDTRTSSSYDGMVVERAKVPNGWLVRTYGERRGGKPHRPSICYVPDPASQWDDNDDSGGEKP